MKDIPKAVEDAEDRHQRLTALDRAHVWHPFTQMQTWLEPLPGDEPVIIDHASGSWLFDTRGRKYLDAISSLWVNVHGHHRAELDSAIRLQLERVAHTTLLGLASPPSIELAAELVARAPRQGLAPGEHGLTKVFYSDSGSTAVEVALKMAFQHWKQRGKPQKRKFVALAEGYHGDTLGSVSVGGVDLFHEIFRPLLFECLRVPAPYAYRWPTGPKHCLEAAALAAESMIHGRRDEIAAMVLEPLVMGAAGMITHPPGYLPLAATLTTDVVYESFLGPFESKRTFFHGHSYTGNPLACAAALASLRLFDEDRTLDHASAMAERLAQGLAPLAELPHVGDIRQRGLMIGIELVRDRKTKEEFPYAERVGHKVALAARGHELLLRPLGNVVVLMPPLSIKPSEVDFLVDGVRESIREATE